MTASPRDRSQGCVHCNRGWVKAEPHLESWPRIVATRNYLFDQGSALILLCQCGGDAQVCTPVARGEVCLRQKDEKEHACTCFSPPFKRRRPGSLPSRCLLLFPLIDLWDLGFFSLLEPAGDCRINHIAELLLLRSKAEDRCVMQEPNKSLTSLSSLTILSFLDLGRKFGKGQHDGAAVQKRNIPIRLKN